MMLPDWFSRLEHVGAGLPALQPSAGKLAPTGHGEPPQSRPTTASRQQFDADKEAGAGLSVLGRIACARWQSAG